MKDRLSKEMKLFPQSMGNVDDVVNAYVLAWTALKYFKGWQNVFLPSQIWIERDYG